MSDLNIDVEEIERAYLVCFGDDEGWHPSLAAGLFFKYEDAAEFAAQRRAVTNEVEWCILRVLPFTLKVVNDFMDVLP